MSGASPNARRRRMLCLVPDEWPERKFEELAARLASAGIEVVRERRWRERRAGSDRRAGEAVPSPDDQAGKRRLIVSETGRRLAERRGPLLPVALERLDSLPPLPRRQLKAVRFAEQIERSAWESQAIERTQLAMRAQAGDRAVFDALVSDLIGELLPWFEQAVGSKHLAEDLTQQTLEKMGEGLRSFRFEPGVPFAAWVWRIAKNLMISHKRSARLVPEPVDPSLFDAGREAATFTYEPVLDRADEASWISDDDVARSFLRLSKEQRRVITMRFRMGMSSEEIAVVMDKTASGVRKLQQRGLKAMEERVVALRRASRRGRRNWMLGRMKPLPVLGARRFALQAAAGSWRQPRR